MTRILELVKWENYSISTDTSPIDKKISIGRIGDGKPTGLIVSGIHGDEGPWSAWAIRKLLEETNIDELLGSLCLVPVANPLAMEGDTRNSPLDSIDLNRSFPGKPYGSHTEHIASILTNHAIKGADVIIDLHGGGSWCVNAFTFQFPGCRELSDAFDAPFTIEGKIRNNTLTGYARTQGTKVVAVEMGGRGKTEENWAKRIAKGLRRALGIAGVLTPINEEVKKSIPVGASKVLAPNKSGIFAPELRETDVGTIIQGGTILGRLLDPVTMEETELFKAPYEKTAILLLRPTLAYIEKGAMTYVVAPLIE
ncbi:MAG: succinylglutamate desuccinylase/aspartoacylase family protein [Candidatus Hodarchaeales archaeon]